MSSEPCADVEDEEGVLDVLDEDDVDVEDEDEDEVQRLDNTTWSLLFGTAPMVASESHVLLLEDMSVCLFRRRARRHSSAPVSTRRHSSALVAARRSATRRTGARGHGTGD